MHRGIARAIVRRQLRDDARVALRQTIEDEMTHGATAARLAMTAQALHSAMQGSSVELGSIPYDLPTAGALGRCVIALQDYDIDLISTPIKGRYWVVERYELRALPRNRKV